MFGEDDEEKEIWEILWSDITFVKFMSVNFALYPLHV